MTTGDPRRYVRVMEMVQAGIKDGTFKPGEMLPSTGTLCVRTGFSRPTVGKALRLLEYEGLVGRIPGLGYYVPGKRGDNIYVAPARPGGSDSSGPGPGDSRGYLPPLAPPDQDRVVARVAGEITGRITAGHWPPGTRLPAQRVLAAEHSTNPAIVCLAQMELAGQGILLRIPGVGYFTPGPVRLPVPARAVVAVILDWDDGTRTRLTCTPAHQPPAPRSEPGPDTPAPHQSPIGEEQQR